MKRFAAATLAALMLLTVFASAAIAAEDASALPDVVEIRGPVYNGTDLPSIIGPGLIMDANKFAAFYYDLNSNVTTETLSIKNVAGTSSNIIGENGLVYQTTIAQKAYKFTGGVPAWGNYSVLGFFAEKYIPLKAGSASKIAKLILDDKEKRTVKTGEKLELGSGYALEAKQVDVDGKKVWLEFTKDGQYVDDQIISTDTDSGKTWTCELDKILGEDDVPVLKVHVNQVFQGAVDSIAQIDGIWLIDYANAKEIKSDDEFGKLNNVAISGATITITNDDTFTLTRDSDQEIGEDMFFRVADDTKALRFYAFKKFTDAGTYEVRGQVVSGAQPFTWNASNFAGFFYDLKKNVETESLSISNINGRIIGDNGLKYSTTIKSVDYKSDDFTGTYPVLGFFAEEYVPLKASSASKLAKLVMDSKDKYTVKTGEKLELGSGYALEAKQVDVDGKKVWLEFTKDGQYVDDQIVSTDGNDRVWTCELDKILGEDDVPVLKVHVNQVFQGAVDSIAQIDGLWLIDYANAKEIKSDDEFGKLNNVAINGATITVDNDDTLTLTRDSDQEIGEGMYFKIADSADLRYYPYVERKIGDGNETPTPDGNVTPTIAPTGNETPTVSPIGNDTPSVVETSAIGETPEGPIANNTSTPEKGTPGFEIVPGIVGLLAIVYFVRRNK
jgi:S-layer protein (TIGR01567 family)